MKQAFMHASNAKSPDSPGTSANNAPCKALFFQPKLTINTPGDQYEQEADQMADRVMRMPIGQPPFFKPNLPSISRLQRKCKDCEDEEKMHRKENSDQPAEASSEVASYIGSLSSKGSPLPDSARSFFEPRFGRDFSEVRIHNDTDAVRSSQSVNALAYTVGNNIVFNQEQYSPGSASGQRLMAHELTHVVQQSNNNNIQRQPAPPPPPPAQGPEFSTGSGFGKERSIPSQDPGPTGPDANTIQVSPGEKLIFNLVGVDKDKKRASPTQPWTEFAGAGPYEIDFAITGDAELDSAGSGTLTKTIPSLSADNVMVFVKGAWNGTSGISVTATMKDNAPAVAAPGTGNVKDPDRVFRWSLVKRTHGCPTSLSKLSGPGNTWSAPPIQFTYQALPDLPPRGRPDYQGQTILERFGTVTALGFSMADVEPAYKTANPTLNTPDKIAAAVFSSGANGTFVFDNLDTISDQHDGFGIVPPYPFKPTAYDDADGVGYNLPQEYVCGATVVGSYVISRRFTHARGKEIKKA